MNEPDDGSLTVPDEIHEIISFVRKYTGPPDEPPDLRTLPNAFRTVVNQCIMVYDHGMWMLERNEPWVFGDYEALFTQLRMEHREHRLVWTMAALVEVRVRLWTTPNLTIDRAIAQFLGQHPDCRTLSMLVHFILRGMHHEQIRRDKERNVTEYVFGPEPPGLDEPAEGMKPPVRKGLKRTVQMSLIGVLLWGLGDVAGWVGAVHYHDVAQREEALRIRAEEFAEEKAAAAQFQYETNVEREEWMKKQRRVAALLKAKQESSLDRTRNAINNKNLPDAVIFLRNATDLLAVSETDDEAVLERHEALRGEAAIAVLQFLYPERDISDILTGLEQQESINVRPPGRGE